MAGRSVTGPPSRWSIAELDVGVEPLERVHGDMCRHDADGIASLSPV